MTDIASLNIKIDTSDAKTAKNDLDKMTRSGKTAESQMGSMSKTASKLGAAIAAAFSIYKIIEFTTQIKNAGVELDSLKRSYDAITGSQRLAGAEMQYINDTAKKLGLNLTSLESNYKGIIAASKGTVLEGENTRKIFSAVANASSVLGLSADSTTGTLRALEQMMSKGNVQAEELRGQLGERLPGAFGMAAEAMGVTTQKLNDMLQKGEVLASDLLPKLADVLEKRYGAAAQRAGESSRAAFENFNTAVLELKRSLAESGILEYLAKVTRNATDMINGVRRAIDSINADKAKTSISEYDAAIEKANANLTQFKSLWGNTRELVPENLKSQFDNLSGAVDALEASRTKLAMGLRNEQDWKKYRDAAVSSFGQISSGMSESALKLEEKLREEYTKTVTYRLTEAKKELAEYLKIEGAKPEYVAMLKDEIASLEKKANATSVSGHKSVTASHNKELEEQVRAFEQAKEEQNRSLESFNDDYKKATLSTFEYEVEKLDEMYKEREKLVKAGLITEWQLQEWYADQYDTLYQADVENYYDAQEKKIAAQKKIQEEQLKLEQEAADEAKRISDEAAEAQQDAYDELYDGIYGFTRNVIDDWDDMGNTLVDMAESMVKDIIAAFVTQKIAIPIYMYAADMAGISTGLASGMSPSSGGLASMTSPISSLFTIGKTAYTLVTEGVSAAVSDLVGADLLGSISSAMFEETAATAAALDFTTISPTVASTIESAYAVANGGAATTTSAASGMGAATAAGLAVAAFMAIDTFLGSHDQADPDIYVQSPTGGMTESTATYTVSNRDAVTDEIVTIFDAAFASLDESLDANIVDAVTASAFRGKARITDLDETDANALINALVESAFSGDYTGSIASFEGLSGAGNGTGNRTVTVDGEDIDYWNNILTPLTEAVSGQYSKGLSDILMEAIGLDSGIFNFDFLKSLQAEGENLFDTFANFAIVVQETDGFVENITRQMDEFGFTVEEAFANILVVISVLDEIQASVDALATTSSVAALVTLTESWYALIDSLEAAYATTTQITEAETAMAQVLGANITGLTADALQSALSEGGDIESILQTSIQNAAYADIAQKIAEEYISGINEQIGQVWIDTGGDLEAVAEAMQGIDTTEAQAALEELQESFGLLADSANGVLDTAEAMRIVTLAIDGQLSTSQKFEEWQISNIEAMNLFSEIVADSVTADELESAVDAFAALGIEGDDLNNVIQDLADTFTEATQQMYENISNIESAQDDLIGADDTTQDYLNAMAEVVDFFKDTPSLAQIRGDEAITTTEFDEDAYKSAIADAVVNSEYQSIFGRNADDDYWQKKLIEGEVDISKIHEAILNAITEPEDIVEELYNRLFGHSADSEGLAYWMGELASGGVSSGSLESALILGAQGSDLEYYNENQGKVEITNWEDFETAAGLLGINDENYYNEITSTRTGEFSTSEAEVEAALAILNNLPDIINSSGDLISSALDEFVNAVGTMDSAVLEDIFGSAASEQISAMVSAISSYESSLESNSSSSGSDDTSTDDTQDQIDALYAQIQEGIDTINLSDFEKEIYDINKQAQEWTDSLAELGVTAEGELVAIGEWVIAQRQALSDAISGDWQDIINENTLLDAELQLIELEEWYADQMAAAEELGLSLDNLTQAYDLQKESIEEARQAEVDSLLESASDYLNNSGISEYESQMLDVEKEADSLIEQLTELGATYTELATVTEWLSLRESELADAREEEIDSLLSSANDYFEKLGLSEYESQMLDLEKEAESLTDQLTELGATSNELAVISEWLAANEQDLRDARQSEIEGILESASDYLSKSGMSDFESQMYDLNKEADSLAQQLTELNATESELGTITEWLAANEQDLIDARQSEIEGILESASDYLAKSGLSKFDSDMYDLRKESESLTEQLTELNATESELAVITEWLALKEQELIEARQDEIDSLLSSANDYLSKSGLSDFESQMFDLNNEAESLTQQLTELNATNEELAIITEWLSVKEQELIDARQAEIDAFNKSIQDIISKNTLSDLEYELANLTSWYDEQKASAEGLGVALDAVNEAYELQKKAAYESAITTARSSYIESLQAEQSALEDALSIAKENYINGLNDEITALNETASEAERTVSSFESLLETIKDLKYSSVTDSELNPDKRMAFVESDLAIAMAKIQSGDTAEIKSGMEDLPTLTAEFLELSKQTSGSFSAYQNDFAYVMRILNEAEQIAGDQKSTAELSLDELTAQTESLEATLNAVNGIDENLGTIEELEAAYNAAQSNLDNSWYQDEIDRLTEINSSVLSLTEAQNNYFDLLIAAIKAGFGEYQDELGLATSAAGVSSAQYTSSGTSISTGTQGTNIIEPDWWEGSAYQKEYGDNYAMVLGSHGWSDPYSSDRMTMSDYWGERAKTAKFADGGTVSGPDSGYFMPTTFHGIEHITPDSEMTEVKEVLGEVKDILISIRDTGGNVNKLTIQTNRLLDRVTQGGTEMRVKEIA